MEVKDLKTQLSNSELHRRDLQDRLADSEKELQDLKALVAQQESQMSQKQDLLVSFQKETTIAQESVMQENSGLKNQLLKVSQDFQDIQEQLNDARAEKDRLGRDFEQVKQKYNDAKCEAQTAYKGLENYQVILTKFEENLKAQIKAKEAAEIERDKALNEMRVVRQRYMTIVGVD